MENYINSSLGLGNGHLVHPYIILFLIQVVRSILLNYFQFDQIFKVAYTVSSFEDKLQLLRNT